MSIKDVTKNLHNVDAWGLIMRPRYAVINASPLSTVRRLHDHQSSSSSSESDDVVWAAGRAAGAVDLAVVLLGEDS